MKQLLALHDKTVLLGDFNARIGNSIIAKMNQKFNEDVTNKNGKSLVKICTQYLLRINNTFFPHRIEQRYTSPNNKCQKSVMAYIITNINVHPT